MRESLQA